MKTWQIAVVGLVGLAVAGCQTDPNIALLEQENRKQQDEIYQLRGQLEDCQDALQATRCQGPPRTAPPSGPSAGPAQATVPETPPAPTGESGPSVDVGHEVSPEQLPEPYQKHEGPQNSPPPPPKEPAVPKSNAPAWNQSTQVSAVDSARVAQITLNRALTAGYAAAGSPGQEGVTVVIEPRDAWGRLLAAPGDVQVVALDPAQAGQEARVARWDVTAAETSTRLSDGPDGGIHLNLPWPDRPPAHNKLHLFVRYLTSDGRKLEADGLVEVASPADRTAGWTPARRSVAERSDAAEIPTVRPPEGPLLRTASGLSDPGPPPPVWSPERL